MQLVIAGFEHRTGTSKKDGQAYEICTAHVLTGLESSSHAAGKNFARGFQSTKIAVTPSALDFLKKDEKIVFPARCECESQLAMRYSAEKKKEEPTMVLTSVQPVK